MNPLFEDKVKKIHELMKIMLENFKVNFSYPDVEGLLDELPFPQLYLPLKKSLYEALLDLHIKEDEWKSMEIWNMLRQYGVWGGLNGFDGENVDEGLTYPQLSDFLSDDFKFCLFDLEKYNHYIIDIERYLLKKSSYRPVIQLIYTYLCPEAGVNIKDAIKGNKDPDSYFRELIRDDDLDYAIHFEDDINYWVIDEWHYSFGHNVVKYRDDIPPEYKDKPIEVLASCGWADNKCICRSAPIFTEDLCEAFYASKGEYSSVLFKKEVLDEIDRQTQGYIDQGYECYHKMQRQTGHDGKILRWFDPEKVERKLPIEECVSDYYLDKSIFMEVLFPKSSDGGKVIDKIVSNYTTFLKLIISVLELKKHYTIPDDVILSILDNVYNRLLKASIVTTINLYTRKGDCTVSKENLKAAIRKSHSIGNDRWRSCIAFYSDTLFNMEDLKVMSEHIPQINRIIELM